MPAPNPRPRGRPHTVMVIHRGRRRPLCVLAREAGLSYPTVYKRHIGLGWPLARALKAPVYRKKAAR